MIMSGEKSTAASASPASPPSSQSLASRSQNGILARVESRDMDDEEHVMSETERHQGQEIREEAPFMAHASENQDRDDCSTNRSDELDPLPSVSVSRRDLHHGNDNVHENDDASSFQLWAHSFDTMSDTGTYLPDVILQQAAQPPQAQKPSTSAASPASSPRSRGVDISLPSLGYADLSPIKLDHYQQCKEQQQYDEEDDRRHRRSPALLEPLPYALPEQEQHYANNPLFVLRSSRRAFAHCTFLLSCLSQPEPCQVNLSDHGPIHHHHGRSNRAYQDIMSHPRDVTIATRRVSAAICAFGGTPRRVPPMPASIFRPKGQARSLYEERFHYRYCLSATQVCWEVEEDPPVELSANGPPAHVVNSSSSGSNSQVAKRARLDDCNKTHMSPKRAMKQASSAPHSDGSAWSDRSSTPSPTPSDLMSGVEPPKLKYRCKLCGKPKNNHVCPYRRSIQRSIGVTVQPAVNSFTAHEPGDLTPALSEMNNFVSYDSAEHGSTSTAPNNMFQSSTGIVTNPSVGPESNLGMHSPQSSLSTQQGRTPVTTPNDSTTPQNLGSSKRTHSHVESNSGSPMLPRPATFVSTVVLRPEQYRAVSPMEDQGAFQYPAVPLSLAERRRLSDTLFVLSHQIPPVTEECTAILHNARARGLWDVAVAELLTQVVVALYCVEGDARLDGLQNYLLGLGISC